MRITIDKKLYFKPVNLPIKFNKKLSCVNCILSKTWPWVLTFGLFYGLAVLGLRCF